jgi:hypothetical protein
MLTKQDIQDIVSSYEKYLWSLDEYEMADYEHYCDLLANFNS